MRTTPRFGRTLRRLSLTISASLMFNAGFMTAAFAQADKPQYGGHLSIGTNSPSLAPLSWDPADWNYKTAQDAGFYYDRLFIADLTKSKAQGGPYLFKSDSYVPSDAIKGDLVESFKWLENPLRLEMQLRKGVMFPDKPGVMAARELTSADVVYSYNRLFASPKRIADFVDYVDKVKAPISTRSLCTSSTTTRIGPIAWVAACSRRFTPRRSSTRALATGKRPMAPAHSR